MTTKRIVYTRPDGGISVVIPAPADRRKDEPEDDWLRRVAKETVPAEAKEVHVIEAHQQPNRRFRNAWRNGPDGIQVHVPTARSLLLEEIRQERDRRLKESDALAMRAMDVATGDEAAKLSRYRQQLRDLPNWVQGELLTLNLAQLETYRPQWPEKP